MGARHAHPARAAERGVRGAGPETGHHGAGRIVRDIAEQDAGPLLDEGLDQPRADARGAAGHEDALAGEARIPRALIRLRRHRTSSRF
jgi:hypothetical protein